MRRCRSSTHLCFYAQAYKRREKRAGPEPQLPGLNLTHDQLFFLTYAQIWCGTMRPEHAINTIRTGAHSPGRFRFVSRVYPSSRFSFHVLFVTTFFESEILRSISSA